MSHFFTKKRIIIIVVIVVLVGGGYLLFGRKKTAEQSYAVARRGDLKQEVSVTGHVKPAESVDLAFERGGKVARVYAKIGDNVKAGQTLVSLENSDVSAQLLQAEASLDAAKAKLDELRKGTRPEEMQAAETSVESATVTLANVKAKAAADLQDDYDAALSAIQTAVNSARNSLYTLTDIQSSHFGGNDSDGMNIANIKAAAILDLLGQAGSGRASNSLISTFNGGAFGLVQTAVNNPTYENIDAAIAKVDIALQRVKDALYVVPLINDLTATEKTNLSTEKTNINTQITGVSSAEQALGVQKATNVSAISAAEATLASAKDTLALKKAGTVPEQIAAQEATVKSAAANAQNYSAQLGKTIIHSPINGIVTRQEAKVGEITAAGVLVVSVISENQFEMEANIPEADIAKIEIGDTAAVTLDAYGNDASFPAKLVKIDPGETVIEGVATYKTTFQFINEDERIKSGMTANLDILTATAKNVINVPQRAVYAKDGEKYVRIVEGLGYKEVKVKTGLRGTDGTIEVLEGVSEGDKVITLVKS